MLAGRFVQVIKNHFASEYIYNKYKDLKTCDVIEDNPQVSGRCALPNGRRSPLSSADPLARDHQLCRCACLQSLFGWDRSLLAFKPR